MIIAKFYVKTTQRYLNLTLKIMFNEEFRGTSVDPMLKMHNLTPTSTKIGSLRLSFFEYFRLFLLKFRTQASTSFDFQAFL